LKNSDKQDIRSSQKILSKWSSNGPINQMIFQDPFYQG